MKKILIVLIFVPLTVMGQIFKSTNQQFVEQAIKGSMFVIKQAYQLEDSVSGQRFGRYGNDVFGTSSTLAVRIQDGIVCDSEVFRPWSVDENYSRYQNTHIPVLSQTSRMELGDSIWNVLKLPIDSITIKNRLYAINDSVNFSDGLIIKQYDKPIEGWVVWLSNDSIIAKYEGQNMPEFTIYKKTFDFTPDSISYKIDRPQSNKNVWGGIFVVPQQTSIGIIQFDLAGVLIKSAENDNWELQKPILRREKDRNENHHDELTPLISTPTKKKNKKKR